MLPLDTGAKNTSVPSARVARSDESAFDTSMVMSAAAGVAHRLRVRIERRDAQAP